MISTHAARPGRDGGSEFLQPDRVLFDGEDPGTCRSVPKALIERNDAESSYAQLKHVMLARVTSR